jgi:Holliday junction resolvase
MTELGEMLDAPGVAPLLVTLPSGRAVEVERFLRSEKRLPTPIARVPGCWAPNKPTILVDGRPTWAEFAIVRSLERHGWNARWVKNWTGGREFCVDVGASAPMSNAAARMFNAIDRAASITSGGGAWDVFAWRGSDYLIIESKQHRSSDTLRPGQIAWLEAALNVGVPIDHVAVVEYVAESVV